MTGPDVLKKEGRGGGGAEVKAGGRWGGNFVANVKIFSLSQKIKYPG